MDVTAGIEKAAWPSQVYQTDWNRQPKTAMSTEKRETRRRDLPAGFLLSGGP